jgi:DNA-binding transcriptional LysR family regulator
MNLRQMEVFHAIMVTGSITGAARLLKVTQPAVSTVLKHCETQLKMKLFERVAGRLQPTAEAESIFPEVASIFGRLDAVSRLTQDLVGGRLGTLSIAAAFPIANGYLAKAVATYVSERPNLRATLQSLTSPQVLDRVVNREAQLGVAHEPIISQAVETEVLVKAGISCVMPDHHPLAARDEVDIRELVAYPIITYLPHIQWRPFIDRALSEAGIAPKISVQVSLSITGIMLARHGAGVALAEPLLVASMNLPGLVVRPLRPRIEAKTFLLRLKTAPPSPAIDSFVEHLKQTIRTDLGHQFYL